MNYNRSPEHVVFYANEVVSKGWSRDMLRHALKSEYHLSIQTTEKSYKFDFTELSQQANYVNEVFRYKIQLPSMKFHQNIVESSLGIFFFC